MLSLEQKKAEAAKIASNLDPQAGGFSRTMLIKAAIAGMDFAEAQANAKAQD